MIRETPIGASRLAHARYLHGTGKGHVTLANKVGPEPLGEWNQYSYPVEELHEVVPAYSGLKDVYISQNRFYGSRRIDRLAELSALYADLDYYKRPELASMRAEGVLELALEALIREQIPHPSLVMATGRGLALIWRHEPVPAYVLALGVCSSLRESNDGTSLSPCMVGGVASLLLFVFVWIFLWVVVKDLV